jgi:hypothetical protein
MVEIPRRAKDTFLKADNVVDDDLVLITGPAYVQDSEKFGEKTVVPVTVKRTGDSFRWTLNGTTSDRCREAWTADGDLWENKVLKVKKSKQVIRGEEKDVLYGVPFSEKLPAT